MSGEFLRGGRAMHRGSEHKDGAYALRERNEAYNGSVSGINQVVPCNCGSPPHGL